jgi:hypothetical protein
MLPKNRISTDVKNKRKRAFKELKTTTHWPDKCDIFKDYPNKYKILKPNPPVLSEIGIKLI